MVTTIMGTEGPDTLTGGSGDDSILALGGNDLLIPTAGNDPLDGGDGVDTVDFSHAPGAISGDLSGFGETLTVSGWGKASISNVEVLIGTPYSDHVAVTYMAHTTIWAGAGDDSIQSGNGPAYGEAGNDTISAYTTDNSPVLLDGGEGDDSLTGWAGADTLIAGPGNDTLNGGAGQDDITLGGGADLVRVSGGESAPALATADVIHGWSANCRIAFDQGWRAGYALMTGEALMKDTAPDFTADSGSISLVCASWFS